MGSEISWYGVSMPVRIFLNVAYLKTKSVAHISEVA